MRTALKVVTAGLATLVVSLALTAAAQAASSPSTPVHLSSAQVARVLFVAGDVGRLNQIPSGTEDVVLEKVLQQLYADDPTLSTNQAVSDIRGLAGHAQLGLAGDLAGDADRDGRQRADPRDPARADRLESVSGRAARAGQGDLASPDGVFRVDAVPGPVV